MPAGPRIRSNSEFGLTTDNPLTAGATSFNSARLALMPVVSSAHAVVTLDPRAINGEPEIVVMTAHTAAATVATIVRGQYGTAARSHPQGTEWIHAPIDEDFIEILTSATRPGDPYEGQFIFETDTNKLVGYGGVDWAPRDAGGTIGYAQITATSALFTALTDIAGLSTAVTVGTGRRIKVTASLAVGSSAAGDNFRGLIREGAANLQIRDIFIDAASGTTGNYNLEFSVVLTPSAGLHTYKVSCERLTGGGNLQVSANASFPSFILVEDIGAV